MFLCGLFSCLQGDTVHFSCHIFSLTHCLIFHKAYWVSTANQQGDKCNGTIMEQTVALSLCISSAQATALTIYTSRSISTIAHSHQELCIASHSPTIPSAVSTVSKDALGALCGAIQDIRQTTKQQESWAGRCYKHAGLTSSIKWILWGTKKNIGIIRRGGFFFLGRYGDGGGWWWVGWGKKQETGR